MPRLFVIGAPSGTGKTTLLGRLIGEVADLRFSVSHTTRDARPGEVDGRDYHFVSREAFLRMAEAKELLEWAEVYGNLYGTHRGEVERARTAGVDLVLDIDAQGARSVRAAIPEAVLILILPPSWDAVEARLKARRTESPETIRKRLDQARAQLEGFRIYDYLLINDDLDEAARSLAAVVIAERRRLKGREGVVERLLGR